MRSIRCFTALCLISGGLASFASVVSAGQEARPDAMQACSPAPAPYVESGGKGTTVHSAGKDAFARPIPSLPPERFRSFAFGNKLFNTIWAEGVASVKTLDGRGPMYNRPSCSGCHFKDGRGRPPETPGGPMDSMLLRLSVLRKEGGKVTAVPHPVYGSQLSERAVHGVEPEGKTHIDYHDVEGAFADGTPYRLRSPSVSVVDLHFGPLGENVAFSARVSPAVFGLGLLEAIPEEDILRREDPADTDGDGISGRANKVKDIQDPEGEPTLGRFGWKATAPSLTHQIASAALGDIGLTSPYFPEENCTPSQTSCLQAKHSEKDDLSLKQIKKMEFYLRTLAVPARRNENDVQVHEGRAVFNRIGCASCHVPKWRTGAKTAVPQLANKTIYPYTDLLLHDMGDALADGRPDEGANGNEWRTPPLWGIGLTKTVNGHEFFLHDGRARGLEEAVLWHGGEGEASKQAYRQLPLEDRRALIAFLESL